MQIKLSQYSSNFLFLKLFDLVDSCTLDIFFSLKICLSPFLLNMLLNIFLRDPASYPLYQIMTGTISKCPFISKISKKLR